MVITWYGKNCFKLQSGDLVMVTDPFAPLRGISRSDKEENHLQPFRGRTDIIIKTMAPLSNSQRQSAEAFEISYPGEYEIKNVSIRGWAITASSIKYQVSSLRSVYLLEIDDLKVIEYDPHPHIKRKLAV